MVYLCLSCDCVHGWIDNSYVTKITRSERLPMEDIWYCPNCGKEHRSTDGTILGRSRKGYREVDLDEEREYLDRNFLRWS